MFSHAGAVLGIALASLAALLPASSAAAQSVDYDRLLETARRQQVATFWMTTDALLVALGIESEERASHLRTIRAEFDTTLKGLRNGDAGLGLPAATEPSIAEPLDSALELWSRSDTLIVAGLDRAAFTEDELLSIAGQGQRIRDSIGEAAEVFDREARVGEMSSMMDTAINIIAEIRMLSQRMGTEFLMITNGLQVDRFRRQLIESSADYERRLIGLIEGDVDLLLLPAPTEALRSRLRRLLIAWQEDLEPVLRRAIEGNALTPAQIVDAIRLCETVYEESGAAVEEYQALRP